jgi:transglutaminase-like putative cysteine protease
VGYCEQFAAAFAVMARTLGIPSRVAVGFTPGGMQPNGWHLVAGVDSHAWPEIWFDGIGWIAFEPTPGRTPPA